MIEGRCRAPGLDAHSEGGPGRKPEPTSQGAISVNLEGRRNDAGLLLFHRAIPTLAEGLAKIRTLTPFSRLFTPRNVSTRIIRALPLACGSLGIKRVNLKFCQLNR